MADRSRPAFYTIPAHRAFADALAAGLIRRYGKGPMGLARGLVLLPNNRAKRAVTDAFVRASGEGLLLPRLVAIGDPEIGEGVDAALDPAGIEDAPPPAIAPLARRMILARLVSEERARAGQSVDAAEAVRLAGALAQTLDQLLVEEVSPSRLRDLDHGDLTDHWQRALALFNVVLDRWPDELNCRGMIELVERRSRLLARLAKRWRTSPPSGFICAAGITTAAPAVARLLRCIGELPEGTVVLPGLAVEMDEAEWQALGPHEPDPVTGMRARAIETHPQFQLKLLLDRAGINRGEVRPWRESGGHDARAARGTAVANAMAPAAFTGKWTALPAVARRLSGVTAAELATPADEAQAIALALREVLETPGRTAALVTPDRALARRVAAHCRRWNIEIDDSAGRPLSIMPPGTLLAALAEAAAQRFAPLALLALLKHPLVRTGARRLAWLDGVRALDLALRGPRPAPGLAGIDVHLAEDAPREQMVRRAAVAWWPEARNLLSPIESAFAAGEQPLAILLETLRQVADALCGDALWAEPAGRALADFLADLAEQAETGPATIDPAALGPLLTTLMSEIAVRPPQGGHARLAIYGLLEARLQTADLMVLGGLNEGVWPGLAAPDPWLAPRIRADLGLPGLERRIGLAAHDFVEAMGAPEVLLTRARRDTRAPAIASRFWSRLEAMAGGLPRASRVEQWTGQLDDPGKHCPATRPAPIVPPELRPDVISVTEVDRLKADPFAFYARRVLGLAARDPVDADPSAAWRGTAVHLVLESWTREGSDDPEALRARAQAMLSDERTHPMLRALWQPRLMAAIDWIADRIAADRAEGRSIAAIEASGRAAVGGVTLNGKADRIDRLANGNLAIVDYKTGKPPSARAVAAGYSLQLGLVGAIAEAGGFDAVSGTAEAFEYWSLAKGAGGFGYIATPVDPDGKNGRVRTEDFVELARRHFTVAAQEWLTGDAPFTAKLHPEYAPYAEYDQLMRLDEWYGRG